MWSYPPLHSDCPRNHPIWYRISDPRATVCVPRPPTPPCIPFWRCYSIPRPSLPRSCNHCLSPSFHWGILSIPLISFLCFPCVVLLKSRLTILVRLFSTAQARWNFAQMANATITPQEAQDALRDILIMGAHDSMATKYLSGAFPKSLRIWENIEMKNFRNRLGFGSVRSPPHFQRRDTTRLESETFFREARIYSQSVYCRM